MPLSHFLQHAVEKSFPLDNLVFWNQTDVENKGVEECHMSADAEAEGDIVEVAVLGDERGLFEHTVEPDGFAVPDGYEYDPMESPGYYAVSGRRALQRYVDALSGITRKGFNIMRFFPPELPVYPDS